METELKILNRTNIDNIKAQCRFVYSLVICQRSLLRWSCLHAFEGQHTSFCTTLDDAPNWHCTHWFSTLIYILWDIQFPQCIFYTLGSTLWCYIAPFCLVYFLWEVRRCGLCKTAPPWAVQCTILLLQAFISCLQPFQISLSSHECAWKVWVFLSYTYHFRI